jgi:hypothetical protein
MGGPARYLLRSRLTSNHGVPMGNPHSSVLVTKSAFTYTRKNVLSGGLRNKKCTPSTSRCLSVWAKNILGSLAKNNRAHRKRAVVSLTKARVSFTHRTKKRNPTKPKLAKSTPLDERMAQSRRETLKYTQGTLFRLVLCSCKVCK